MLNITDQAITEFKQILEAPENGGKGVRITFEGFG